MKNDRAEKILDSIVTQLVDLRKAKGLSHEKLAQKVGVTRPAISYIESRKNKPTLLLCLKMAEALDVSLAELINTAEK